MSKPKGPATDIETDFSQVPAAELKACELWEYAREAQTFRKQPRGAKARQCPRWRRLMLAWNEDGDSALKYFPQPWQALPQAVRSNLARRFPLDLIEKGEKQTSRAGGFRIASDHEVTGMLEAYPCPPRLGFDGWGLLDLAVLETHAITINWAARNDEIVESFRAWLTRNRPSDCQSKAKGKKVVSFNVALERIATMRIIKRDAKQGDSERNKEVRRARERFQHLFPELRDEYPLNWPFRD